MKRLIASAIALSVVAVPAVAATTTPTAAKVTKQVKKTDRLAAKTVKAQTPKKK